MNEQNGIKWNGSNLDEVRAFIGNDVLCVMSVIQTLDRPPVVIYVGDYITKDADGNIVKQEDPSKMTVSKYTKKPVVISAIKFNGNNSEEVLKFTNADHNNSEYVDGVIKIKTLEGVMTASVGDFIIKGIKGEFYPCKPDIFEKSYDPLGTFYH